MNTERLMKVILAPLISEKGNRVAEKNRQVVFKVMPCAKKPEIKAAVELMFEVKVDAVRVLNVGGKKKRSGQILGQRKSWRKAYVSLQEGHDINFADL